MKVKSKFFKFRLYDMDAYNLIKNHKVYLCEI